MHGSIEEIVRDALCTEGTLNLCSPFYYREDRNELRCCLNFREYANAVQDMEPTRVHIPDDTQNLLTALIDAGAVTIDEAYKLNLGYGFDDDGRESLTWPEPAETLTALGYEEIADELCARTAPAFEMAM